MFCMHQVLNKAVMPITYQTIFNIYFDINRFLKFPPKIDLKKINLEIHCKL